MKSQDRKSTKVFVGLSGGVDSAVSAAVLQKAGYDVTGVFIKVWQPDWIECTCKEDRRDAMRVAAHLDIPFVTLDLEKEYKQGVIDYMIAEYAAGRTPNPDVMCNREVKFGAFWEWAKKQGAEYIATGHYARVRTHVPAPLPPILSRSEPKSHAPRVSLREVSAEGRIQYDLLAGRDTNKDQSYFLWTLNQDDLPHILFPVGDLIKPEVRKLAKKFNLPNADKKDSQGLCFIGKIDIKEFLAHYITSKAGNVVNTNGAIIGTHPGALFFTIGERHGFLIREKKPNESAHFVISKNMEENTITVAEKDENSLPGGNKTVNLKNVNWIRDQSSRHYTEPTLRKASPAEHAIWGSRSESVGDSIVPTNPSTSIKHSLQARSRYRQTLQNAKIISVTPTETVLEFEKFQDTLTPGQSMVIYDGETCVGGGIIQ